MEDLESEGLWSTTCSQYFLCKIRKDKEDKDSFIGPQEFVVGYSKAPDQPQSSARPIYHSHTMISTGREPATICIAAWELSALCTAPWETMNNPFRSVPSWRVHIYSPDIPLVQQAVQFTPLVLEHSFTVSSSLLWREWWLWAMMSLLITSMSCMLFWVAVSMTFCGVLRSIHPAHSLVLSFPLFCLILTRYTAQKGQ